MARKKVGKDTSPKGKSKAKAGTVGAVPARRGRCRKIPSPVMFSSSSEDEGVNAAIGAKPLLLW